MGCMMGAAIGDALGKQNEGIDRRKILERGYITDYGTAPPGCPGAGLRAGQYTDDMEQMMVLSRSLIECNGFDVTDFAGKIARWGAEALADHSRRSIVGPSSAYAIDRLNSGINWKESGSDIPSCGSAMRVAPIGLFYIDIGEVESNAALSSIPTHNSKGAIAGAVAVAVAVRCSILGKDCPDIIRESCARASNYDIALAEKIQLSFDKKDKDPDEVFAELGTSYLVHETVPSAFYCFSRHFENAEEAIIEAVNAGGDTDSIACITGAMSGALHGPIRKKWIRGLENNEEVAHCAGMLFNRSVSLIT